MLQKIFTKKLFIKYSFLTKVFLRLFIIFSVIINLSCATSSVENTTQIKAKKYSTFEEEPFYKQNQNLFIKKNLSNNIPVIIKKSTNQKNCAVTILIDKDQSFNKLEKSGIEEIAFDLMMCGTKKYSALYISSLEYTDSTKIKTKVNSDFLEYSFVSQKEKIDFIIPIFAQIFKSPNLANQDFENIYAQKKQTAKEFSSEKKLLANMYKVLNDEYSYFNSPFILESSDFSYNEVLSCHKAFLNARKIKIFVSGNFSDKDVDDLYSLLNEHFGKISSFDYKKKNSKKDFINIEKTQNKTFSFDAKDETNNLIALYNIPLYATKEYISYGLLSLYLDDCLYDLLKQKSNAALDAGTGIILGNPNLGLISVYNIQNTKKDLVFENAKWRQINLDLLKSKVELYKRIYMSFVISTELSAEKTVRQMILSEYYANDALEYIKFPFYIQNLNYENVKSVFENSLGKGIILFTSSKLN